ncbi:MAG: hypothetical protein CBARDMAM_6772, partial [uncultured Caballeronia sp.]
RQASPGTTQKPGDRRPNKFSTLKRAGNKRPALRKTVMQTFPSFWAAVNHLDRAASGLGLLERQLVKVWLNRAYGEMDNLIL